MLAELLFVAGLSVGHGIVFGAETSILEVSASRVRHLVSQGVPGSRALAQLRKHPDRVRATTRSTMAILAALGGVAGGIAITHDLTPAAAPLLGGAAGAAGKAFAVGAVALLFATVGALVPRALAVAAPERYAASSARLVESLARLVFPAAWLATGLSNLAVKPFGPRAGAAEPLLSHAALHEAVDEASKVGTVDARAAAIARRAFDFGRLTAEDVLVPRTDVVAISVRATIAELQQLLLETGHSRVPVYGATIDEILGYISAKDVLALTVERALFVVQDLLRPAYFVPVSMRASLLLDELRARAVHLAFVTDAQGGLAGIVTMEDLLEELVGDIVSEHDPRGSVSITRSAAGEIVVDGAVAVRDVNRELDVELPESDDWSTVAGLCIALAGRIPQAGDRIRSDDGTLLEILDASNQRVRSVRVSRPRPA